MCLYLWVGQVRINRSNESLVTQISTMRNTYIYLEDQRGYLAWRESQVG